MMQGNIFASILYLAAMLALTIGVFCYRKSNVKLGGLVWSGISVVTVMAYGAILSGIMTLVHIPVNIISMGILFLITAVFIFFLIHKEGKKQEYHWEKFDLIVTAFVAVMVFGCILIAFTPGLHYAYSNTDAGLHFREATTIVRAQKVNGMYFNHFYNAMIIEVLEPFVKIAYWYRAYIVADSVHLWLEVMFFVLLIREFLKTNVQKLIGLAAAALYFFGYPFFSFYFAFVYWGMGTMLIAYLILILREYKRAQVERKYTIPMLMAGCYSLVICYMLFAPFTYILIFAYLMLIAKREGKIVTGKNVRLALKVFLFPCVMGIYYCYFDFFVQQGTTVTGSINNDGGIYTELYIDFLLILLPVIFYLVRQIRNKNWSVDFVFTGSWIVFTGAMLGLVLIHKASTYYFYKMYYPLWMFCWCAAVQALCIMTKEAKDILISYVILYAGLLVLCFGQIEYRVLLSSEKVTEGYHSPSFFTLYRWGQNFLKAEHGDQNPDKMDLYDWIITNLGEEEVIIPLMTETGDYGETYFYEGVVGWDCGLYYGWRYDQKEIWKRMEEAGVKYITVLKNTEYYEKHEEEVNEWNIIFENEAGMIIETSYEK